MSVLVPCRTRKHSGIRTLPKLTVRVRFPSPAPHAKSVAIHMNWAPFPHLDRHPSASEISTRAITRAISHAGRTVSSSVYVARHAELRSASSSRAC
jgi:hypothetical protein